MSQIADITVFDGAATPVSHTLKAISVNRNPDGSVEAVWREGLTTLPVYAQVRAKVKLSTMKDGKFRSEVEVVVPVMENVLNQNAAGYTAAPKVAYENTLRQVSMFHPRSDINGRRLSRQILLNLMGNIATSVVPTTTGFVPELVDQLIVPT